MAWGDHERSERRLDEQMKQAQGYLAWQQQQLANQQGGYNNIMFGGGGAPQVGNTYGYGSTVPHWSPFGSYYEGNGTDTPSGQVQNAPIQAGYGQSAGAQQQGDPKQIVQQILSKYPPGSASLEQAMPEIQKALPGTRFDTSGGPRDEIVLPNGQIVDLISNAETGGKQGWTYQTGGGGGGSMGYGGGGVGGVVGQNLSDYGNIMGRYEQFADTGGYSDQDLANIRSRALSPIRSMYSTAQQKMEQQRALQGGYSPGFATAMGRFARERGQLNSDAATNAEAAIAEMRQRGQLAGMGGMASMYGATPGLSNMFGNQMLQSQQQGLTAAGLQNQLSLGLINQQNDIGRIPGNMETALGMAESASKTAGNVGNAIYPWLDDTPKLPSTNPVPQGSTGMPPTVTPSGRMDDYYGTRTDTGDRIRTDMGPGPFGGYQSPTPYTTGSANVGGVPLQTVPSYPNGMPPPNSSPRPGEYWGSGI